MHVDAESNTSEVPVAETGGLIGHHVSHKYKVNWSTVMHGCVLTYKYMYIYKYTCI